MRSRLLDERRQFSRDRLRTLRERLNALDEIKRIEGLSVYATGSFARQEASPHSDIDLFFVHSGSSQTKNVSRLDELRLFAKVIEIGEEMQFPTFSNDGEFLKILYTDDMLEVLGGRLDDYGNYFTARMLLLLESTPLVNERGYRRMMESIIEAYFRDYPDHARNFRPVFLINDIIRFWKTLCLNYENKRNRPRGDAEKKRKQQIKNFKLKFSRLMTCFGTVVAVCSMPSPIEKDKILELTQSIPLDRFLGVTDCVADLRDLQDSILADYLWFMEFTALPTGALHERFTLRENKKNMFSRADVFGGKVYQVLEYFAERNEYDRYLVI